MNIWDDLQKAADSVKMGNTDAEPPGISHLPDHVKQQLLGAGTPSYPQRTSESSSDPAFRKLPEHLKDNPYANMSRQELLELYEEMKKDPNAYKMPGLGINEEFVKKAQKDGKPYIDPEGGATIQPSKGFVVKTKDQNGQKVFVNMVSHYLVDPPEEKYIPDSDQPAVRIPLSTGDVREDFDKKGNPCQVIDVIWNPETIKSHRQGLIEFAFEYIKEKHGLELNLRYQTPKMKYKGKTVQFQRIRAKKTPKIDVIDSKPLSPEEQQKIQEENYAKVRQETIIAHQKAEWKLYWVHRSLANQVFSTDWWTKQIFLDKLEVLSDPDITEEEEESNYRNFMDGTNVNEELIEEYDGLNSEYSFFVILVKMQTLMRGHSIKIITQGRKINVNLCNLNLNLPKEFDNSHSKAFFDWKKRTLILILPLKGFIAEEDNQKKDIQVDVIESQEKSIEEPVKESIEEISTAQVTESLNSDELLFELV